MGKVFRMSAQEALREIMNVREWTYALLSARLGLSLQTIADKLNKRNAMSVAMLLRLCEAMDCELVIRSKLGDRTEWVITEALKPDEPGKRGRPRKEKVEG